MVARSQKQGTDQRRNVTMTHDITQRSRIRAALAVVLLAALATTLVTMFGARPAEAAFPDDNGKIVYEGLDLDTWNYEIYSVETD